MRTPARARVAHWFGGSDRGGSAAEDGVVHGCGVRGRVDSQDVRERGPTAQVDAGRRIRVAEAVVAGHRRPGGPLVGRLGGEDVLGGTDRLGELAELETALGEIHLGLRAAGPMVLARPLRPFGVGLVGEEIVGAQVERGLPTRTVAFRPWCSRRSAAGRRTGRGRPPARRRGRGSRRSPSRSPVARRSGAAATRTSRSRRAPTAAGARPTGPRQCDPSERLGRGRGAGSPTAAGA